MKRITNENLEAVRESYTLVNKSSLLSLAKTVALCLLKNINMKKKTEIEPFNGFLLLSFFAVLKLKQVIKFKNINKM